MQRTPGPGHRLGVTARRIGQVTAQRLARRLPPGKGPNEDAATLRRGLESALERGGSGCVAGHHFVELPGDRPPWFDTGIDLRAGERWSWFASGRVYLSRLLDIFVEPHFQLWGRVGAGPIFSGSRATHTFTVPADGRLHLASYFPGEWADESGRLATSERDYQGVSGRIAVGLVRWQGDALAGLTGVASRGGRHPLIALEIDRLRNRSPLPRGWELLWYLGDSEIYHESGNADTGRVIECCTRCDVGILRRELDLPLLPGTTLDWSWRVDALPSSLAEDVLPTHDYLSIAVEFDNGIDLTYYWSAELPAGTGYWCPLPTWKDREYHVVQRSGPGALGCWLDERRDLHADYTSYIGTPPTRIRRVWLIANSLFQRGEGRCAYRAIRMNSDGREYAVL
jgi:hypothetical protein